MRREKHARRFSLAVFDARSEIALYCPIMKRLRSEGQVWEQHTRTDCIDSEIKKEEKKEKDGDIKLGR